MSKLKLFILHWLPVFCWMGIIFYFSSRQRISVSDTWTINFAFFKTLHLLEYSFLFLLVQRAVRFGSGIAEHYSRVVAFIFVVLYAATDEIHQTFVPTREGTLRDVIIDSLGAGITWIILIVTQRFLPTKLKHLLTHWQII